MERRKTILVVDDEVPIRKILEMKLKNCGYDVLLAEDGEEALRLIEREKPDAVITDINMPRMDGRRLCEAIEPIKSLHRFLTIIMTARIIPDEEAWIRPLRDTVFMEKPFSPGAIQERIDHYFGVKR